MTRKAIFRFLFEKKKTETSPSSEDKLRFQKINSFMEEKKPFLSCDYSLTDLAFDACSNKTYTSRTINQVGGKNFNGFVNSFRIEHAVEIMNAHPELTVKEVSQMSGFHNPVTFNKAFKEIMGETPGVYERKIRRQRK